MTKSFSVNDLNKCQVEIGATTFWQFDASSQHKNIINKGEGKRGMVAMLFEPEGERLVQKSLVILCGWQNGKLIKWQVDKMASWQSGKLTKWLVEKMVSWENGKLTKEQVDKTISWWNGKLTKWQVDKMASWQNGKLTKWQVDKMASWQNGNLTNWLGTYQCSTFQTREMKVLFLLQNTPWIYKKDFLKNVTIKILIAILGACNINTLQIRNVQIP